MFKKKKVKFNLKMIKMIILLTLLRIVVMDICIYNNVKKKSA